MHPSPMPRTPKSGTPKSGTPRRLREHEAAEAECLTAASDAKVAADVNQAVPNR